MPRSLARRERRNNAVVGVLAMGEGWHNNHHAFPTSARHGLRWQIDFGYYLICLLGAVGLAWNIKVPSEQVLKNGRGGPCPSLTPGER